MTDFLSDRAYRTRVSGYRLSRVFFQRTFSLCIHCTDLAVVRFTGPTEMDASGITS